MKLQTKLIIAFSSIVILMGSIQFFYFQNRVESVFENYVKENQLGRIEYLKDLLIEYYQYDQSWNGIQQALKESGLFQNKRGPMWKNNSPLMGMGNAMISVADENGIIVGDMYGEWLGKKAKDMSGIHEDLVINGQKIGELIVFQEKTFELLSLEREFITSVNKSILFGSLIAVAIAVLLGLFISARVTKPLESLMIGIKHLAKGNHAYRLRVNTRDEFYELAEAFNHMSKQLEENEQVRKGLVADVAHELRTPLSILRGRLESIQEGAIEPTPDIILQLNDEVFRLTRLVNDLQQLSLAEAGKLPLKMEKTVLNDIIKRVIENFQWLADEKEIVLSLHASQDVKAYLDSDRITQVIVNLLGNALRHTPENGTVKVNLKLDSLRKIAMIVVEDSGSGIDKELLPFIFERFYRTDSSRNRDQGGTGLGLAIAKGYVEAHHGKISVISEAGKGTSFTIELPIEEKSKYNQ